MKDVKKVLIVFLLLTAWNSAFGNDKTCLIENIYFEKRLKKTIMINNRSRFNYFVFHFSSPVLKTFRNQFLKRLIKSKSFINRYLGQIYN